MSNKRNLGVDLLRIVCIIMIVTLHVLLQGGCSFIQNLFS